MVLDYEYFNCIFILFDLIYYIYKDLKYKSFSEPINILNELNFEKFNNKIIKKLLLNALFFPNYKIS